MSIYTMRMTSELAGQISVAFADRIETCRTNEAHANEAADDPSAAYWRKARDQAEQASHDFLQAVAVSRPIIEEPHAYATAPCDLCGERHTPNCVDGFEP